MNDSDPPRPPRPGRRYLRNLAIVMVAYAVLLAAGLIGLNSAPPGWPHWPFALIPVPAVIALAAVVLRYIRVSDEMQGRMMVESMAIGFAFGSIVTFTYGFLQLAGAPQVSWLWVWPVYGIGWIIGRFITSRRY